VSSLYDAIQQIQLKANFSKSLADRDLDVVYLSALNLSTAVIDCLATAIHGISSKKRGMNIVY
jgi:hypothetical protein